MAAVTGKSTSPADEYLSGNVREKLEWANGAPNSNPEDYAAHVQALERVQPVDLTASEIAVRLGATWLPPKIVEQFMFELFSTSNRSRWNIHVHYFQYTGEWNVEGKSYDKGNIKAHNTYGTKRINGYQIIEETLNLRDVRIYDFETDHHGNRIPVLNKKETAIARASRNLSSRRSRTGFGKTQNGETALSAITTIPLTVKDPVSMTDGTSPLAASAQRLP